MDHIVMRSLLNPFLAVMVAAVAISASATDYVVNGDFEAGYEFNTESNDFFNPSYGPTGWRSPGYLAFNLYFNSATATTVDAQTQYGSDQQRLASSFVASPTGGKFMALDGVENNRGPIEQSIEGLTTGATYVVAFDWGASQLENRVGETTEQLVVGFGKSTQSTAVVINPTHGFQGWFHQAFTFTADAPTQLLSFLSIGTPLGLPPIAVLDGVSVTDGLSAGGSPNGAVPEPAAWAMMIVGFGLIGIMTRRHKAVVAA